jgi:hypothetical protein
MSLAFILGFILTQPAWAESDVLKFAGVVQFSSPPADIIGIDQSQEKAQFKTVIDKGDLINVPPDGKFKLVTANGCTATIYGPAKVKATTSLGYDWRVSGKGLRWSCAPGAVDKFRFEDLVLEVRAGEVFLRDQKALALRGEVDVEGLKEPLQTERIYSIAGNTLLRRFMQNPLATFEFNESEAPPSESVKLEVPRLYSDLLIFSAGGGSSQITHDYPNLNAGGGNLNSVRLQYSRPWGSMSLIEVIGFQEAQDSYEGNMPVHSDIHTWSVEGGARLWDQKWWSPYARLGLGWSQNKINIQRNDVSYFTNQRVDYLSLLAAIGVDAVYYLPFLNSFGLYGAIEARGLRTLTTISSETDQQQSFSARPPEANETTGGLTAYSLGLQVGAFVHF